MLLSIVIATYNRSAFLKETLLALEDQTDKEFEVIIASDGSTDDTEDMVANLKTSFALKFVDTHCPDYGLAVARNRGILAAEGEAVAILDDDSVPEAQFVEAHKKGVRPGVISGGPRWPHNHDDQRMAWKAKSLCAVDELTPLTIDEHRSKWPDAYLIENNISMYRDDLVRMGMFSERLKLYGFIGQEFFERADHLAFKFQVNHAAAIQHYGEIEGDNGLFRSRKSREVWVATMLRPSLSNPRQYKAQIEWATQLDKKGLEADKTFAWPSTVPRAIATVPYAIARTILKPVKQRIRALLK